MATQRSIRATLEHERDALRARADEIDRAIATMDRVLGERAAGKVPKLLKHAIAAERARKNGRNGADPVAAGKRRTLPPTAELLAAFNEETPTKATDAIAAFNARGYALKPPKALNGALGKLTTAKYLRRQFISKADRYGYVRTAKAFRVSESS